MIPGVHAMVRITRVDVKCTLSAHYRLGTVTEDHTVSITHTHTHTHTTQTHNTHTHKHTHTHTHTKAMCGVFPQLSR